MTRPAYKFLRARAVSPLSRFVWPEPGPQGPGPWVETRPFRGASGAGIHGCDADHLVYWLDEALWGIELDGEIAIANKKLIAPRGRSIRRLETWDRQLARGFADAGVARARNGDGEAAALARGYLADAITYSSLDPAASLFCAAHAGPHRGRVRARAPVAVALAGVAARTGARSRGVPPGPRAPGGS